MTERILEILKRKNLSPSQFADEIGVQRSSISHLVSGRNKPSLEFIQKVISRFPDINPEWILSGTGPMEKGTTMETPESMAADKVQMEPNPRQESANQPDLFFQEVEKQPVVKVPRKKPSVEPESSPKSIEKIVIFYSDKTFREYLPE